jgi:hypothetical protein
VESVGSKKSKGAQRKTLYGFTYIRRSGTFGVTLTTKLRTTAFKYTHLIWHLSLRVKLFRFDIGAHPMKQVRIRYTECSLRSSEPSVNERDLLIRPHLERPPVDTTPLPAR